MLIVEGTSQLLEQPEFQDMRQARDVFNLLEEREELLGLLRSASDEGGRSAVFLGGGARKLEGLGLVAAPYEVDGRKAGMIGVLGPRRMHYSKLTAVVEYTAGLVGRILTRLSG
jgi:heat-inducible transcriptional repressor